MARRILINTVLFSAYFAFFLSGMIDATQYSYEELIQKMSDLEKKVEQALFFNRRNENTVSQFQLSRKVKILESRIAEMSLQQTRSNRRNEMLETRISQLEEQVVNNERTIEHQQSKINILKTKNQEKADANTPKHATEGQSRSLEKLTFGKDIRKKSGSKNYSTNKGRIIRRSFPQVGQVAFTAILDHNVHHAGVEQKVVFNKVLLNDGSAYNTNTGVFTVPTDGVYMFYLAFAAGFEPHQLWMHIVVDGHGKVSGTADTLKASHDAQGTNLVLLHLHKGDSVWVSTYFYPDVTIYGSTSFTSFSGVLLY